MKINPYVSMNISKPKRVKYKKLTEIIDVIRTEAYRRLNIDYFSKNIRVLDPKLNAQTKYANNAMIINQDIIEQLMELSNRFNYLRRNKILAELKILGKALKENLKLLNVNKDIIQSSLKNLGHIIAVKYSKLGH